MALGGIQVISPDVKLFYKRQNNLAEKAFGELSLPLPLTHPTPSSYPPSLPHRTSQK